MKYILIVMLSVFCLSNLQGQGYNWLELNSRLSAGDTLGAIFYLKGLLKSSDSGPWEAHYNLGLLYNKSQMRDSSIYHYEKATDLNTGLYQPHYHIGHYYFESGDMEKATYHYSLYLNQDSENWEIVHHRGQALMSLGDFYSAVSDWTSLIKHEEEPGAVFNRGLSKLGMSDYEGAIVDFDRVLALKGNKVEAHYYKGICLENLFDLRKAEKEWKEVIRLDPAYENSYYRLAKLYFSKNKKKKSCTALHKGLDLGIVKDKVDPNLLEFCSGY